MKYVLVVEDHSDCPYYAQTGDKICDRGCWQEPVCMTNEPLDGWPETVEFDSEQEVIQYLGIEELNRRLEYDCAYATDDDGNKLEDWPDPDATA